MIHQCNSQLCLKQHVATFWSHLHDPCDYTSICDRIGRYTAAPQNLQDADPLGWNISGSGCRWMPALNRLEPTFCPGQIGDEPTSESEQRLFFFGGTSAYCWMERSLKDVCLNGWYWLIVGHHVHFPLYLGHHPKLTFKFGAWLNHS